jgi:DNA-binding Lrp family transcriptional regulator
VSIGAADRSGQEFAVRVLTSYRTRNEDRSVLYNLSVLDDLDARLIRLLSAEPRLGVLECSRRLGVARGTVQARLDRLTARGVVRGFGPDVDPAALGYDVTAFVTVELRQGLGHAAVAAELARIPEVLEAHTVIGAGDMFCRVVARSNADLQRVIDAVVAISGIVRTNTVIALAPQIPYRVLPLVRGFATGEAGQA